MAGRSYAKLLLETWGDPDWRALPADAQRLYMLLLSQPTLSPAGCLPWQSRKWSQLAADTTVEAVENALAALQAGDYVRVDADHEEVWIRTFIRHDGWVQNKLRAKAVESAIGRIESPALKAAAQSAFDVEMVKHQSKGTDEATSDTATEVTTEENSIPKPEARSLETEPAAASHDATSGASGVALDWFVAWRAAAVRPDSIERFTTSVKAKERAKHSKALDAAEREGRDSEWICQNVLGMDASALIAGRHYANGSAQ